MHDDTRKWYFLLFHTLSYQIVLEEMAIIDIATNIATFLLFAFESFLTLARTRAQKMIRDFPAQKFLKSPAAWRIVNTTPSI